MKRKPYAELAEGFDALKAEREGKITLRRHTAKGKSSGVKMHSVQHEQWLIERLKKPKMAAAYLEAAIEDGDQGGVMLALRHVAKAQGLLLSVKPVERKLAKAA